MLLLVGETTKSDVREKETTKAEMVLWGAKKKRGNVSHCTSKQRCCLYGKQEDPTGWNWTICNLKSTILYTERSSMFLRQFRNFVGASRSLNNVYSSRSIPSLVHVTVLQKIPASPRFLFYNTTCHNCPRKIMNFTAKDVTFITSSKDYVYRPLFSLDIH